MAATAYGIERISAAVSAVLAEIQAGDRVSMPEYARTFDCDPCTAFRHVTKGVCGADGLRIKLEAAKVGNKWLTSKAAIARFVAATTASSLGADTSAPTPPRSPTARRRASDAAAAELAKMGC